MNADALNALAARPRAPTRAELERSLAEANKALDASIVALRSHGHQGITWELYAADAARVRQLKEWLDGGHYAGPRKRRVGQ